MKLLEANTNEQNTNSLNIYLYTLTLASLYHIKFRYIDQT